MTKLAVTYPDVEETVYGYLTAALADAGEICTLLIGVPTDWTKTSEKHLQIACDGTPLHEHPMVMKHTVRLTAWAQNQHDAKALVTLAQGLLCAAGPGYGIAATRVLTGVLPARDPQTHAEIASNTTRVSIRSAPIEPSGS